MTSRYAAVHDPAVVAGPGDARPTAVQIVEDEGLVGALPDAVGVVTGTSSGIGPETVRGLAATGMTVFALARDLPKTRKALGEELLATGRVHLVQVDLGSLASVRKAGAEIREKTSKVTVLVNNAGVMATDESRTVDGFETQFGTNHLGHFLLFLELRQLLLNGSTPGRAARVVNVSSSGHQLSGIVFGNVNLEDGAYDPWVGYGQAKTANILMANAIHRKYGVDAADGTNGKGPRIEGYSVMPGGILTDLQRHGAGQALLSSGILELPEVKPFMKSAAQGAATQVWAAIGKDLEGKGGVYLENCAVAGPMPVTQDQWQPGYAPHAFDPEKEDRLWELSLEMVGWKEE
jgi:NAD(P)-dependent dehydrogenase (short-subunit alcohol dehydrogenase family)